ncbi:MAG TPA: uridine kinase [Nocardioidaceae bacterium]
MTSAARQEVLAAVASRIPLLGRPVLVAVDGVDGAGKTTFADELAEVVRESGRFAEVVRASVDGFHHPRAHRHALGRTGETFWSRSFDYPALLRELVAPWRAGPGSSYRVAVRDVEADRALDLPPAVVPARGLLVVDGIFLQRDELHGLWDLAVFLDVPFAVSVSRMARRDGSVDDPEHPDQARYVEGQRIYLTACDPRSRADVVVDNADLAAPRII